MVFIGSCADEIQRPAVHGGAFAQQTPHLHFAHRRRHGKHAGPQLAWDFLEKFVDRLHADHVQHAGDIVGGVGNECHVMDSYLASSAKYFS